MTFLLVITKKLCDKNCFCVKPKTNLKGYESWFMNKWGIETGIESSTGIESLNTFLHKTPVKYEESELFIHKNINN